MKRIAEMTAAEQIALLDLARDHQPHGAPDNWDEWKMENEDTNGIMREWHCFSIECYIAAVNDRLEMSCVPPGATGYMSRRWHAVVTADFFSARRSAYIFQQAELGGVECHLPTGLERRTHVRQIHIAGDGAQEPEAWQIIKKSAGKKVRVRITGCLIHEERPAAITAKAWEAGRFVSFKRADRRCPTVQIASVEIVNAERERRWFGWLSR